MELLFHESSLQLAATIVRPIIKSTDHKESDLRGFSLLSPLTVLWQYIHPSFSTKHKLNSPSHKSVPGSCTKRIGNPNSLFLVFLDNPRLSKHKVVPFRAPTNAGTPSHSNNPTISPRTQHFTLPIQHIALEVALETLLDHHHLLNRSLFYASSYFLRAMAQWRYKALY